MLVGICAGIVLTLVVAKNGSGVEDNDDEAEIALLASPVVMKEYGGGVSCRSSGVCAIKVGSCDGRWWSVISNDWSTP